MRNHQEAPLEETQTDSQLSVEGEGVIALVDLPDTLGSFPRNDTVSSMPLEDSQRNEILIAAVKFLTNLSKEEAKKHTAHNFIEEAVDYITVFMDELLSSPSAPLDRIGCVAGLLHPPFISQLFQLRGVFRGIAAEEHPGIGARVTIISWVDDFLVKLCACILHLATNGAMQDFNKRAGTGSVGSLQNNEARKAATQLPTRFTELPGALTSKYSSPAMARMALTLLYGTTVLLQRYEPDAGQIETQLNIADLVSVVSTCITKYGVILDSPSPVYPLTFVEYAILSSLYAYSVYLGGDNSFVPHTEHNVVGLVDMILDNISVRSYPPSNNSGLSTILAEDLCLVEWFWNRWGDGSTSFAATGLRLTRHWIQHYKSGSVGRNEACIEVLFSHSPCSLQALLHLVEPVAEGAFIAPSPSPGDIAIIKIVCEAYTTLAMNRSLGDLQYEDILVQACKRLCPYILVSGMDEDAEAYIHKTLLSFLVSASPTAIRTAYGDAEDLKSTPNPQGLVDKVIQEIILIIDGAEERPGDQAMLGNRIHLLKLKYMLDFLAIFLHSNTSVAAVVVSSSVFLPKLISWMSRPPAKRLALEPAQWSMIRTSVLLSLGFAHTYLKTCRPPTVDRLPEHEQDTFLEVVLDDGGKRSLETSALACYMIATEDVRILDDPVVMLEVWSHIRDGLLATLQRRYMTGHESIAVAVSGTLCASLVSFLHTVGKQTRAMVLASPWTQTLRLELERVMVQREHLDDFGLGLRRQLEEPATVLLRKITGDTECSLPEDPVRLVCVDVAEWLHIVPMFVA